MYYYYIFYSIIYSIYIIYIQYNIQYIYICTNLCIDKKFAKLSNTR